MQRRAERLMPGKRQLLRDGEDSDFFPFLCFSGWITRQDESCLGKIHLTRESLHFPIIQAARVGENGERITAQRCLGEDVKLNEFVSAAGIKTYQSCAAESEHFVSQLSTINPQLIALNFC